MFPLKVYAKNVLCAAFSKQNTVRQTATTAATTLPATADVLCHSANRCGIVQLNRPHVRNALNADMVHGIYAALQRWQTIDRKSLVILKSSSPSSGFCSGGDLRTLMRLTPAQFHASTRDDYKLMHLIGTYRAPHVALMDGITMGSGAALAVHARYRVGTERTVFAMPETAIGLFPDAGASYFLSRLRGELGTYLALTSSRLRARDVWSAGLATHYCKAERLADLERALLVCCDDNGVLDALRRHCEPVTQRPTVSSLEAHRQRIDRCFAADTVEDIIRHLEADGSDWAVQTLDLLPKLSPLSMKVTLRLLRFGRRLSLAECLQTEYRVMGRFLEDSNFKEAVAATLMRNKATPNWKFQRIEHVPDAIVDRCFMAFTRNEDELRL